MDSIGRYRRHEADSQTTRKWLRKRLEFISKPLVLGIVTVVLVLLVGSGTYALFLNGANGPSASNQSNSVNLDSGLVGYWPLAGNAKDMTPYSDEGTVNGGATLTADRQGMINGAYSFNGSSYIVMNEPTITVSGPFTVSMWIDPYIMQNAELFSTRDGSAGGSFDIQLTSTGALHGDIGDGPGWLDTNVNSANNVISNTNKWYLVTYVVADSQTQIYVNGQLNNTVTYTSGTPYLEGGSYQSYITIADDFGNNYFDGAVSGVRVYNRDLSSNEVVALYNTYDSTVRVGQAENGLIGQWLFNGNLNDSSPYGNNAVASGTMSYTTDRQGQANGALNFANTTNSVAAQIGNGTYFGGNNPLTAMAWVDVSSASSGPVFGVSATSGWNMPFLSLNGLTAYGWIYNNSQLSYTLTPGWHSLAITYNPSGSGTTIFYVDGQQVATGSGQYSASGSTDYFTTNISGAKPAGVNQYLINTAISDVRAYSTALSGTQIASIVGTYRSQISGSSLMSGLMGYWPLDGNAKDMTPYGNNGTVSGAILTSGINGLVNGAYSFNGSSNYIDLPIQPTYSALTVSLWFKATSLSTGANPRLLANNHTDVDNQGFELEINNGGSNGFFAVGNGTSFGSATWNDNLTPGVWYNYVGVYTGSEVYAYINSVQVASVAYAGGALDTGGYDVNIGRDPQYVGDYFDGSISNVRIYNRALSASEVEALYSSYN